MKTSSIKDSLPSMAKITILLLLALILPANLLLQLYTQHQEQGKRAAEMFSQMNQLIESKKKELDKEEEEFSERCIRAADIAVYCISLSPESVSTPEAARELAARLDVDEIHCVTPDGKIVAGTHPEYYGYTFDSGEQMRYFLPMLKDRGLKLCQEITPNTAEGKKMQYAAVWKEDGSGIIQIGMEPRRLLKEMEENSLEKTVAEIPIDMKGFFHVLDLKTDKIAASTDPELSGVYMGDILEKDADGKLKENFHCWFRGNKYCVYTKTYGDTALVRCYLSQYPLKNTIFSTMMVLIYLALAAAAVIGGIVWYVDKKLTSNLTKIINELKQSDKGDFENITVRTQVKELDELILYMNQMLKSIRLGWDKMIDIIDKGQIPVGIFEHNQFFGKNFVNGRLLELLGIEEDEFGEDRLPTEIESRLEAVLGRPAEDEQIYQYDRNGEETYLKIEKQTDEQSVTYYVTDMSMWWREINELREQSNKDSLTGLYNRRGFHNRMDELFSNPHTLGYGAVIMLDADGLKRINDIYGHPVGDEYLKKISLIAREAKGPGTVAARLGGDEFIIFLYGFESLESIEEACGELKARRGEQFTVINGDERLEFSVGCALYPDDGRNYHSLMYIADERMYLEKRKRKITYTGGGIRWRNAGKIKA